jgi:hypothetical protein
MIGELEDLYQTRTNRDRNGTIPDEWNRVLLFRELDRLICEGAVERVRNVREINPFPREKIWYREISTGNLYVYVAGWERGSPEFRRHTDQVPVSDYDSAVIQ